LSDPVKYGKFVIATSRLTWIDRKGAWNMRTGNAVILAKRLESIRCEARLCLLDGTKIGGCEKNPIDTDKRVRWTWWYDQSALFTDELIGGKAAAD
jgi:hypothetical protein